MSDKPILFSAPMVRAHLADRKTMTRRIIKPQPPAGANLVGIYAPGLTAVFGDPERPENDHKARLRFKPGDCLWVREAWRTLHANDCLAPRHLADDISKITYEADPERRHPLWAFGKLRPGIHMPRWASRLTLIVNAVKVERLQDISEEDAIAEGIWAEQMAHCPLYHSGAEDSEGPITALTAITCYSRLWEHINGPGSWEANPWVAAISYSVHLTNIDAMEKAG